jgi:hypothetical protein
VQEFPVQPWVELKHLLGLELVMVSNLQPLSSLEQKAINVVVVADGMAVVKETLEQVKEVEEGPVTSEM